MALRGGRVTRLSPDVRSGYKEPGFEIDANLWLLELDGLALRDEDCEIGKRGSTGAGRSVEGMLLRTTIDRIDLLGYSGGARWAT
jgi:hypothetical protein